MDSPRWLITTLKGVYVVENFLLGWSPRLRRCPQLPQEVEMESTLDTLEKDKSLLKPDRCRHTAITKGSASSPAQIPRTTQPTIQNHLRRHLPSSTPTTLHSTLLYEPNSTHPTLLNLTLPNPTHHPISVPSQAIPHAIRSRDQCQDNGRCPHHSVGSTSRIHLLKVGG